MPAPINGQSFVAPQSGGSGGWMAKIFGGIGDNARARSMAQIQYDLHEGKSVIDTRETNARTTHRVAAETAGKVFQEDNGYKRGYQYKKKHDKWNAQFARENEDLKDNPIYVGTGEVSAKGVKQQKAASVRYPDRTPDTKAPTDGATTGTVNNNDTSNYNSSVFNPSTAGPNNGNNTPPNTPPSSGGGGGAAKKTAAKKAAAPKQSTVKTNSKGESVVRKSRAKANAESFAADKEKFGENK